MGTDKKRSRRGKGKGKGKGSSKTSSKSGRSDFPASAGHNSPTNSSNPFESSPPLILTADKRRGVYECDYCRSDISQVPRIRCAVCPDFDLCLECFADPNVANTVRASANAAVCVAADEADLMKDENSVDGAVRGATTLGDDISDVVGALPGALGTAALNHDHTHGYRVADSTRFPLFLSLRGVIRASEQQTSSNSTSDSDGNESNVKDGDGGKDEKLEDTEKEEARIDNAKDESETVSERSTIETNDSNADDPQKPIADSTDKIKPEEQQPSNEECEANTADKKKDDDKNKDVSETNIEVPKVNENDDKVKDNEESEESEGGGKKDESNKDDTDDATKEDNDKKADPTDSKEKANPTDDKEKATPTDDKEKDESDAISSNKVVQQNDKIDQETESKIQSENGKETKNVESKQEKISTKEESADNVEAKDQKCEADGIPENKEGDVAENDNEFVSALEDKVKAEKSKTSIDEETKKSFEDDKQDQDSTIDKKDVEDELIVTEDPKHMWTVEEDLRLLDAISTLGLGNWADICEAVAGNVMPSVNAKSAKRCMERYIDDYLGRYGHILPMYTFVEDGFDDEDGKDKGDSSDGAAPLTSSESDGNKNMNGGRIRKRSERKSQANSFNQQQNVSSNGAKSIKKRKWKVVPTESLPGYDAVWPNPYLPPIPGVKVGDDVGRDHSVRSELAYVKALATATNKKEANALRKEWTEKRLNQIEGPKVLPPRLEDVRSLPGSELAGFMPRRGDFDIEWDNDAESILADMEFSTTDHPQDRALKIQIIEIYNTKLDEREKRKKFLVERKLLDYRKNQAADQMLPSDERDLVNRLRLFARFHSAEEHEKFVKDVLEAKRLRKEISKLQMYRRMGIKSLAEAERFELDRNRREAHRIAVQQKEMEEEKAESAAAKAASGNDADGLGGLSTNVTTSSSLWKQYRNSDRKSRKSINRTGNRNVTDTAGDEKKGDSNDENGDNVVVKDEMDIDTVENNRNEQSKIVTENIVNNPSSGSSPITKKPKITFNISQYPGYDLLSSKEIALCEKLELLPEYYLEAKKALIRESLTQGLISNEEINSGRKSIFKIDIEKRNGVIDFIMQSGWISSKPKLG